MTAAQPNVVGQIVELQANQIDATDRMLPLDPVWVDLMAGMLHADGQLTPIEVCQLPGRTGYKLVVGAHRHAAAAQLGIPLRAEIVTSDAAKRKLREASENVNRRTLAPLDRAKAVAELVEFQKAALGVQVDRSPQSVAAAARWQTPIADAAEECVCNDCTRIRLGG